MSFDIFLQWHERGDSAGIPVDRVRACLGPALIAEQGDCWQLHYGEGEDPVAYITMHDASPDLVSGLTVNSPCVSDVFWRAIYDLLCQGNAVLFFPDGAPLVAHARAREHLPEDMIESLGEPRLVQSGADIVAEIMAE